MLEFRHISDSLIRVFKWEVPEVKVGSISDQCCYTLIKLEKVPNPIKIKYEVGKGGFLSKKKESDYIYRDKMMEMFRYLFESEKLRDYLKRQTIELSRKHIEEDTYMSIIKKFEK